MSTTNHKVSNARLSLIMQNFELAGSIYRTIHMFELNIRPTALSEKEHLIMQISMQRLKKDMENYIEHGIYQYKQYKSELDKFNNQPPDVVIPRESVEGEQKEIP